MYIIESNLCITPNIDANILKYLQNYTHTCHCERDINLLPKAPKFLKNGWGKNGQYFAFDESYNNNDNLDNIAIKNRYKTCKGLPGQWCNWTFTINSLSWLEDENTFTDIEHYYEWLIIILDLLISLNYSVNGTFTYKYHNSYKTYIINNNKIMYDI